MRDLLAHLLIVSTLAGSTVACASSPAAPPVTVASAPPVATCAPVATASITPATSPSAPATPPPPAIVPGGDEAHAAFKTAYGHATELAAAGDFEKAAATFVAVIPELAKHGESPDEFWAHNAMMMIREAQGDPAAALAENDQATLAAARGTWKPEERETLAYLKDRWHRAYLTRMLAESRKGSVHEALVQYAAAALDDYRHRARELGSNEESIAVLEAYFAALDGKREAALAAARKVDPAKDDDVEDLYLVVVGLAAGGDGAGADNVRRIMRQPRQPGGVYLALPIMLRWLDHDAKAASRRRVHPMARVAMIEPRVARFYEALEVSPPFDESFVCTLEGISFEGAVDRGSKGSLQGIAIYCPLGAHLTAASITVRREGVLDRLGKTLRINREFRCGDRDFDDTCYVEGEVPDATLAPLFASAEVRRQLLALLRTGLFREIKIEDDDRLFFYVASADLNRGAEVARALVDSRALVAALQAARRDDVTTLRLPGRTGRIVATVVVDVLGFAGFLWSQRSAPPPTLGTNVLASTLVAVVCLAHLALLVALFRGRANSLRLVAIFTLLGVALDLLAGTQLIPRLDMALDHGPRREVPGRLVPFHDRHAGWIWQARVADASVPIDVPVSSYGAPAAGRAVTFQLGDGAFGVPYIASTTLE